MTVSQVGINFIKGYEKLVLQAYLDQGGKPTIGYGCIGRMKDGRLIQLGLTITAPEAEDEFNYRVTTLALKLDHDLGRDITQNQFDALVSLAYNIGLMGLERSDMWTLLQARQMGPAADHFIRYDKIRTAAGTPIVSNGLLTRRKAEQSMFATSS